MLEVTDSSVEHGFKHLETIASLHFHKPAEEQVEAVANVLESFGMDEEARAQLLESLSSFIPKNRIQASGWMMMGFMAGVSAAQNALESV